MSHINPNLNLSAQSTLPTSAQANLTVLIFFKALASPVVLYAENPNQLYEELKQLIKQADPKAPKLIEKTGAGPLKRVSFLDTELAGVAIQAEPIVNQR